MPTPRDWRDGGDGEELRVWVRGPAVEKLLRLAAVRSASPSEVVAELIALAPEPPASPASRPNRRRRPQDGP